MWILFDDVVRVDYHKFSIGGAEANPVSYGRGGQANGLCGAAEPGILVFTTGRRTGEVPLRIEEHETAPIIDPIWTEVVEGSFTPEEPEVLLIEPDFGGTELDWDQGTYRVRFCAIGFDNEDRIVDDPPERYLLQFWPAPTAPDKIVRQTSTVAAYWHRVAQETPPAPTAAERAEAARQERQQLEERAEEFRGARETSDWGGRLPDSDRLRSIGLWATDVARVDRDLVDEVAAAEPGQQRAMAAWVARWAVNRAGHDGLNWVAEALDALDRGAPLPPSFTDFETALHRLWDVPTETVTHQVIVTVTAFGLEPIEMPGLSPEVAMIYTILATRDNDPLAAALKTLKHALDGGPVDLAAFRAAFHLATTQNAPGKTDEHSPK